MTALKNAHLVINSKLRDGSGGAVSAGPFRNFGGNAFGNDSRTTPTGGLLRVGFNQRDLGTRRPVQTPIHDAHVVVVSTNQ